MADIKNPGHADTRNIGAPPSGVGSDVTTIAGTVPVKSENLSSADQVTTIGDGSIFRPLHSGGGAGSVIVEDEGTSLGSFTAVDFRGAGVAATNAGGGVARVTIPGGATVIVEDEGASLGSFTTLDFRGAGVTASDAGGGVARMTIPGGGATDDSIEVINLADEDPNTLDPAIRTSVLVSGPELGPAICNLAAGTDGFNKRIIALGAQNTISVVLPNATQYDLTVPAGGAGETDGSLWLTWSDDQNNWLQTGPATNWSGAGSVPFAGSNGTQVQHDVFLYGEGTSGDPLGLAVLSETYIVNDADIDGVLNIAYLQSEDVETGLSLNLPDPTIPADQDHLLSLCTTGSSVGAIVIHVANLMAGAHTLTIADSSQPSGAVLAWNPLQGTWFIVSLLNCTFA